MTDSPLPNPNPFSATHAQPIAIVGGGISGLAAAYELARHGVLFHLFEQTGRFGGIIETIHTGGFTIECGPDSWVTEKPWTRELAVELGMDDQLLPSNDRLRRTYLVKESSSGPALVAIPEGMRMMVPLKWAPLLQSPLFSWPARLAYLREPGRTRQLKASAPGHDESVADFVRRHFGEEVTQTVAGPLLSGIFGGDIEVLSVRAVMPSFVKMEAEHGSLITAVRQSSAKASSQPIFTTLASGLQSLVERMVQRLPAGCLHLNHLVTGLDRDGSTSQNSNGAWRLLTRAGEQRFRSVILAAPADSTRKLLASLGGNGRGTGERMASLLPSESSSAILVALAFERTQAARMKIPEGFGFLVPAPVPRKGEVPPGEEERLLACTFLNQKFSHCAPPGAVLLRAFFGGSSAEALLGKSDEVLAQLALGQLSSLLGPLPTPAITVVRRWPRSLPQYAIGHMERIAELESLTEAWPGLYLVGNAYRGVGLSDLIRGGQLTALKAGNRE